MCCVALLQQEVLCSKRTGEDAHIEPVMKAEERKISLEESGFLLRPVYQRLPKMESGSNYVSSNTKWEMF